MAILADFFLIALIVLCATGLALLGSRCLPQVPFAFHFCLLPLFLFTLLYFIEYFVPLGEPTWIWLPAAFTSLWLIQREGFLSVLSQPVLRFFAIGFSVCFLWRYFYPDLLDRSGTNGDLSLVVDACQGRGLPMQDLWINGSKLDVYYPFMFYGAGWLHRIFACGYGLTYQLAYCFIAGYTSAALGSAALTYARSWKRALGCALVYAVGGNGASLFVPLMCQHPNPEEAVRFVGGFFSVSQPGAPKYLNDFGTWMVTHLGPSQGLEAPMGYPAYCLFLGDFHPPLFAFLILGFTLLALASFEQAQVGSWLDHSCTLTLILAPGWLVLGDPWTAPLQAIVTLVWLGYRLHSGRSLAARPLILHVAGAFFLLSPALCSNALSYHVDASAFWWSQPLPPFSNWLLVMFPAVVCSLLLPFIRTSWSFLILVCSLLTGLFSFLIRMAQGDLYDTALQTWPWVYLFCVCGTLMAVRSSRFFLIASIPLLFSLNGEIDLMSIYVNDQPPTHAAKLDGDQWLVEDPFSRGLLSVLGQYPQGVIIESNPHLNTPALNFTTFAGQRTLAGASWEESEERLDRSDLAFNEKKIEDFYHANLEAPRVWLGGAAPGGIDYIVWQMRDNDNGLKIWKRLNDLIKTDYAWHPVWNSPRGSPLDADARPVGIWIKRRKFENSYSR